MALGSKRKKPWETVSERGECRAQPGPCQPCRGPAGPTGTAKRPLAYFRAEIWSMSLSIATSAIADQPIESPSAISRLPRTI
ncbi:hypothetical protein Pla52n_38210 [Stieleria varia]|uniref:Uncharacterized protein n=1 Tax=Stieleria varia TaxID=2528005 RepID=A0A5C6AUR7_9BACT|nr:hypothetical protein Pla52n_38210 [Stieleria varia]